MKKKKDLCNGDYCIKKETCQLYVDFLALIKDGKFPRSITSTECVEPIWQNDEFVKSAFSRYKKNTKEI